MTNEDIEKKYDSLPNAEPIKERGMESRHERVPYTKIQNWIRGHVGQYYDKVLSEWVKLPWLDPMDRTRERLNEYIMVNTFIHDGKISAVNMYCNKYTTGITPIDESHYTFYMNPKTKVIHATKKPKTKSWEQMQKEIARKTNFNPEDGKEFHKKLGIWYEVILNKEYTKGCWVDRKFVSRTFPVQKGIPYERRDYNEVKGLRQLSAKELRRYGLINDSMEEQIAEKKRVEEMLRREKRIGYT